MNRGLIVLAHDPRWIHWSEEVSDEMRSHPGEPRLLTVEQFAARSNLGRTNVYARLASGEIDSVKIGRLRRIPIEELDRYVERLRDGQAAA